MPLSKKIKPAKDRIIASIASELFYIYHIEKQKYMIYPKNDFCRIKKKRKSTLDAIIIFKDRTRVIFNVILNFYVICSCNYYIISAYPLINI